MHTHKSVYIKKMFSFSPFPLRRRKIEVELLNNDLHATWHRVAVEQFYSKDFSKIYARLMLPAIKSRRRHKTSKPSFTSLKSSICQSS